ncbi:uncharacterized protein LOC113554023 [Rhopalosiphum maidis]|uniref:uncharacterized protein LOC113554023 n=1 Tax=Rhopalosiphum maidis TaxID=43146 RepID=UPI000EFF2C50|nr:uncharacterized protein LOC113554023 [Rhopalosiphum maidis]XP_026813469.1 uncharacterized protein LOC113554023 [Rhopalosiphum maidis]XP_026813470.1 uncharacterized protein LOC113554023 [Rhopalosiphum maidis]
MVLVLCTRQLPMKEITTKQMWLSHESLLAAMYIGSSTPFRPDHFSTSVTSLINCVRGLNSEYGYEIICQLVLFRCAPMVCEQRPRFTWLMWRPLVNSYKNTYRINAY